MPRMNDRARKPGSHELHMELVELLRLLQRRNRAVMSVGEIRLSLAESHVLTELDSGSTVSAQELARLLLVNKQAISRLVRDLVEGGLVAARGSRTDGRAKLLSLTPRGRAAVAGVDASSNATLRALLDRLTPAEETRLVAYFRTLADGLAVPEQGVRLGEPELRPQIRRLTRAFGLISARAFGSALTPLEWHILAEIDAGASPLGAADLSELLEVATPTVVQCTRKLTDRGLLTGTASLSDRRRRSLALSKEGHGILTETRELAAHRLGAGLRALSTAQTSALKHLLEKIVTGGEAASEPIVRALRSAKELNNARRLAVRYYYALSPETVLPGSLFPASSRNFGLYRGEELLAAIELAPNGSGHAVRNLVVDSDQVPAHVRDRFAERAIATSRHAPEQRRRR